MSLKCKKIFIFIGVIMAISLTTLLTSCTDDGEREEKAKRLLTEKYGKEFEITEIYRQGISIPYFEAWAYEPDNPTVLFSVTVDIEGDGFSDTYVQTCVCEKISDSVELHMDTFPGTYYVHTETQGMQPYSDNANIDIKSYWRLDTSNRFDISIFAVSDTNDVKTAYQSLIDILDDFPYLGVNVTFYAVDDEALQNIQDYYETNDKTYMDFEQKLLNYPQIDLEYQNGALKTNEDDFADKVGASL